MFKEIVKKIHVYHNWGVENQSGLLSHIFGENVEKWI